MPANLTPQYRRAEEEYRRAQSAREQIECLERMLRMVPKHKGTEKLQADLKTRLKDARGDLQNDTSGNRSGPSYRFPQQGAGTVVVIGAPNAGKSRILAELTRAEALVAVYPFSTRVPLPGMMPWHDASAQLIDTPPVTDARMEPYMTNLVRSADAVVLAFDGSSDDAPEQTVEVIRQFESRKTLLENATGFDDDDFSIVRIRTLLAVTRADDREVHERLELLHELNPHEFQMQLVELGSQDSRESLRNTIYEMLNVIRVYTKKPGRPADYTDPYTISSEGTIDELAHKVHRDQAAQLKFAKVWGSSAHDGQTVGCDHRLCDRDLVELHW